jgi:streptogramin lyase
VIRSKELNGRIGSRFIVGKDNNVWYQSESGDVSIITKDLRVVTFPVSGVEFLDATPTVDSDGNLWITEYGQIVRITPRGSIKAFGIPMDFRASGIAFGSDNAFWFATATNSLARLAPPRFFMPVVTTNQ